MKALEGGKWKMPWTIEAVCSEKQCGAKLLVEEKDVKPIDYSERNDFYAECAICGTQLHIPVASLPLRLQKILNKKRKYRSSLDY